MIHYQVQLWSATTNKWVYIKELMFIYGRPIIHTDSRERLTRVEAQAREALLTRKHKGYNFRVVEVN